MSENCINIVVVFLIFSAHPSSRMFATIAFSEFKKKNLKTIDLYMQTDVNLRATKKQCQIFSDKSTMFKKGQFS